MAQGSPSSPLSLGDFHTGFGDLGLVVLGSFGMPCPGHSCARDQLYVQHLESASLREEHAL